MRLLAAATAALVAVASSSLVAADTCDTRSFPSDGSGLKPVSGWRVEGGTDKRRETHGAWLASPTPRARRLLRPGLPPQPTPFYPAMG